MGFCKSILDSRSSDNYDCFFSLQAFQRRIMAFVRLLFFQIGFWNLNLIPFWLLALITLCRWLNEPIISNNLLLQVLDFIKFWYVLLYVINSIIFRNFVQLFRNFCDFCIFFFSLFTKAWWLLCELRKDRQLLLLEIVWSISNLMNHVLYHICGAWLLMVQLRGVVGPFANVTEAWSYVFFNDFIFSILLLFTGIRPLK